MILPSGLELGLSADAPFDHQGNWTRCPDGHFWYWVPAPETGSPPFALDYEYLQMPEHAEAPKNRDDVKKFIRVVERGSGGEFGWRGEWLSTFPRWTKLDAGDLAAWNKWIESAETNAFLDKAVVECQRLAEVSRKARGYAVFFDRAPGKP
jgi:hypothetical protein